jgi:AcrR family transcriptional regulator
MRELPIDIGSLRRGQIIEAAVAVITEQGLQNLSLSEIEKKTGMKRGQLTYYFKFKEDILLGVFDRLVQLAYQRLGRPQGTTEAGPCQESGWSWVQHLLTALITQPPPSPEFGCLQYTFLAQVGHREDFRRRLAKLYEEWRSHMGGGLAGDFARRPTRRSVSPRALATLVQAIIHGLAIQATADPNAFDRQEMLNLCLDVLGDYLWGKARPQNKRHSRTNSNSTPLSAKGPARPPAGQAQGGKL